MAAGNYFKNFRFAEYKFGDNTDIDLFNSNEANIYLELQTKF